MNGRVEVDPRSDPPDSFDSLLRAAAEVSDVPVAPALLLEGLSEGTTLSGGRFRIGRLLGRGGMGAVYEADDLVANVRVALKVLSRVEPRTIRRFKNEFRILADTIHPHLVRLRDLFMENGIWFFTMDLIEGEGFAQHVARSGAVGSEEREAEIRRLLPELIEGVAAIHATGNLHRDLKPANVLVSSAGSVVIVDFGLVGDAASARLGGSATILGTPAYMAPEQARGEPATTASDWYAVGTILHEALTGRGAGASIGDEPLPPDLAELCAALRSAEAASRPDHAAIVTRLGASGGARPAVRGEPRFVGRERELRTLGGALLQASAGALVVCRVFGPPGIGKTALLREFLRRTALTTTAVVLEGRCYEREAVPFKLLEGVVDSLSEAIERHSPQARASLLPLSPLFLGLPWGARAPRGIGGEATPEARDRAVRAFRSALVELSKTGPLILHVDDVQWCDADGVGLLGEVLEAPTPPVLLVLAHRDEEPSDALRGLWNTRFLSGVPVVDVRVGPLSREEVSSLVREATPAHATVDAVRVAWESEGSPYFALEITRHALERNDADGAGASLTLERTILERAENLPGPERRLLDVLSVCDGPVPWALLGRAAAVTDVERAIAVLRAAAFVRTRRLGDAPGAEPYHCRVSEVISRTLPPDRLRRVHGELAAAFEELARDAWEALSTHHEGAGDRATAADYARRSAERATRAHAFEQGALFYRRARRLGAWSDAEVRTLEERLGDALAMCGHNAESAEAYERAATDASEGERVRLGLLAAGQLLCSGRASAGVSRLMESIEYLGVHVPDDAEAFPRTFECLATALSEATATAYADEASVDPNRLLRVDACYWAAKGLYPINHRAGPFLSALHLLEAVRAGEPMRIARAAYAQAAASSAPQRPELAPAVAALMAIGDAASARVIGPRVRFFRESSLAWQCHFGFDVDGVARHVANACALARTDGHGLEADLGMLSAIEAMALLARFEDPAELGRIEPWRRDAVRRGDLNLLTWMRCLDSRWWLDDSPRTMRDDLLALLTEVSGPDAAQQAMVWGIWTVLSWVERYMGLAREALGRAAAVIERARGAPLWLVPKQRVAWIIELVASAIAVAEATGDAIDRGTVHALLDELPPEATGAASLLRAGVAAVAGDRSTALRLLVSAEEEPGRERTRLVVAGARYARGLVSGDLEGRALARGELESLRRHGAKDPARLFKSWWPGFG